MPAPRVRSRSGSKEFNKAAATKKKQPRKASSDYDSDDEEAFKQLSAAVIKKRET